jgi:predicted nucleic acid-binding protein
VSVLVVDASVIVQVSIDAAGLGPLTGYDLVAPPILPSEALSTLHEMKYRGEISTQLARAALDRFSELAYEVHQPAGLSTAAWDIAESLGWAKTYDAEYVALARMLARPLVTLDARLRRGAARMATILDPSDLAPPEPPQEHARQP